MDLDLLHLPRIQWAPHLCHSPFDNCFSLYSSTFVTACFRFWSAFTLWIFSISRANCFSDLALLKFHKGHPIPFLAFDTATKSCSCLCSEACPFLGTTISFLKQPPFSILLEESVTSSEGSWLVVGARCTSSLSLTFSVVGGLYIPSSVAPTCTTH